MINIGMKDKSSYLEMKMEEWTSSLTFKVFAKLYSLKNGRDSAIKDNYMEFMRTEKTVLVKYICDRIFIIMMICQVGIVDN